MKKRIWAMLLTVILLTGLISTVTIFANGSSTAQYRVTSDKSVVSPGEEVTFNVRFKQQGKLNTIEATIDLPEGLELKTGSLKTINKSELGWDDFGMNESALLFSGYGSESYTGTEEIVIATFTCTVTAREAGDYVVSLIETVADDENYDTKNPQVSPVTVKVVIPATGVSLNKTSAGIKTGETVQLSATVSPDNATNKEVTWTTDNASVATVTDNGLVSGVKKGTATITATTKDGGYKASCVVTVECSHASTTVHPAVASTCTAQGNSAYTTCNDCGEVISGSAAKLPLKSHTMTKHDRVEADHFTAGSIEYYICDECAKLFRDAAGKNEITGTDTVIPVVQHTYSDTWSYDETVHWHECSCGDKTAEGDHTGGTATCSGKAVCEVCGAAYGNIDPNNHTASDWKSSESEHYKECTLCGAEIEGSRAAHTSGDWIIDKKATFTEKGSKHKECTVCGKVMETEEIPELIEYEIVEGANGTWEQGEGDGTISFRVDFDSDKFEGVRVDNVLIDESNYDIVVDEVTDDNTDSDVIDGQPGFVVVLKEEYLNALSAGTHNITIVSSDGEAITTFEVKRQTEPETTTSDTDRPTGDTQTPPTGDGNNMVPLFAMLLISAGVFAAFIIINGTTFRKNKTTE